MFTLAHLSDLHATPVRPADPRDLLGKRLLGWLSWRAKRSRSQLPEVLDALLHDLAGVRPDQIVVTGDLTNVSLEAEFAAARTWLERMGGPDRVSVVPGNHDAYVSLPRDRAWGLWTEYLDSDPGAPDAKEADVRDPAHGFPTLRVRGPAAFVGLSSARPTAPFLATGRLGERQLARLERLLAALAETSLCRVVLVHHPVTEGTARRRRELDDAAALRAVLRRTGADLVLHGHTHETHVARVEGPEGPIPVVGVRSASNVGNNPKKRAQWHLYEVDRDSGNGHRFRLRMRVRGYDRATGSFRAESEEEL